MDPLTAATTTQHGAVPWLLLAGLAVLVAGGYALSCWLWPFAACTTCNGAGKRSRSDGKVWRPCRRCKGSGRRLRVGRWLYRHLSRRKGEVE